MLGLHVAARVVQLGIFGGTQKRVSMDVSDSFVCSWDPVSATRLPSITLILGFVPSLIGSFYVLFS